MYFNQISPFTFQFSSVQSISRVQLFATPWIVARQASLLEKAMAPHSSSLAWKIPWMEEPGGLQSMGSLGVGHDWVTSLSLFHFHALEKEMATHSSVLAWRIPGEGEPGGLTSMGSHRVGHDWSDLAAAGLPVHHQLPEFTQFSSVQSLSLVRLFATPWIPARQTSLSITSSLSSLRLTSVSCKFHSKNI